MKKYGMIFASVIFTLAIMLIPNHEVRADTFVHNNSKYDIDEILVDIKNYNSDYTIENYPYISVHPLDNGFNFYMINSIDNNCYDKSGNVYTNKVCTNSDEYFLKVFDHGGSYGSLAGFNGLIKYVYNAEDGTYTIDYSSGSTNRFYFPGTKTNKNNYYNEYGTLDGFYDELILYSNFSFFDDITEHSTYVSYKDFLKINFTSGLINDLDGNSMKNITIDFENFYNKDYIYQYKTNFIEWTDITSYINDAYKYGYYYYNFFTYYNILVEARVLDSYGNVIAINSLNVTDLIDYSDDYIYRNTFSSSTHSDLKYISFQANHNELGVSHKFRIQYLSNDKKVANIPDFINYKGYLVDYNGVILDYNFNDYFSISYDEYKLYDEDYEQYLDGIITQVKELPGYVYGFKIVFEFDNLNNYTINVFDNYSKNVNWSYVMNFLDGYTLIKFPSNYDTAIIRSKDFTNLSSSLIYMNVLFSSSEYGLNFYNYDFINGKVNYSYTISDVTIDYSMISFNINETNNIFPVLFRNSDSDEVFIYLKDDCFIQFINRDTLNSYIVGSDEDIFNNNNDLIISDDFNDFIDHSFYEISFIEKFSNGFENFKDVISEIFQNVTYFFEGLSIDLQYFYYVVFAFVIVIFLTRFIL